MPEGIKAKLPVRLAPLTDWSPSNARPIKIVRSLSTVPNIGSHSTTADQPRNLAAEAAVVISSQSERSEPIGGMVRPRVYQARFAET